MMLANVFTKTIKEHWLGWLIAFFSLVVLLLMAMGVYREMDVSLYSELPDVYRSMIGISESADVASLSINALVGTYGALTIAAMTLAMGAGLIAGEERRGTLGLLLSSPKSRTYVLVSKTAAMVLLTILCVIAIWGAVVASAAVLDISIEGMDVGALSFHMLLNSLFYGFLALAISTWTGNRGAALGVSIGVMVMSFVAVGVLPLIEKAEDYAKAFPWHYFTGSKPLLNGVNWGDIGILSAGCAILAAIALIGVNRRDLKTQSVGITMIDRLRSNPLTEKLIGRLAGSARISSIWAKTASEYQVHFVITAAYMFTVQGLMMGPLYAAIPERTRTAADAAFKVMPEAMLALFGGGGLATPEAFYQIETFGMMMPIGIMVVAIAIGAGALAGEEEKRTIGLLLANPIKRSRVVRAKALTMVLFAFAVGIVTFAGVALGATLGDLGMSIGNIASACLLGTLVGLVFGSLSLALSAGTGRRKIAIWGAVGAGLAFHVFNSLTEISDVLTDWAWLTPFHYYIGNDPLNNGMDWVNAAILAAMSIILITLSVALFQRRDIRQTG